MDNREVALELLKLFLEAHRERVEIDELVDSYLYILDILEHGHQGHDAQPSGKDGGDDSLFDFKKPLSVSDKDG